MRLTADLIATVFPRCPSPELWANALAPAVDKYGITTSQRLSSFLAQAGYESAQFTCLVENLTYTSAAQLMRVWPKRFLDKAATLPYVSNPEKLANYVYSNRLGNGDEASGDGYRFRGRGVLQLTGRSNYAGATVALGVDLIAAPDSLTQPSIAAMSAAWFWSNNGLNALADDCTDYTDVEDFSEITRRINGGTVGIKERLALLNQVETALA